MAEDEASLLLEQPSHLWSCCSSSLILSRSLSTSLDVDQSISRFVDYGAKLRVPDCTRKGSYFFGSFVMALPASISAIGARLIGVTFDAMYTAPVTSSRHL